jgi:hypothetical protein
MQTTVTESRLIHAADLRSSDATNGGFLMPNEQHLSDAAVKLEAGMLLHGVG